MLALSLQGRSGDKNFWKELLNNFFDIRCNIFLIKYPGTLFVVCVSTTINNVLQEDNNVLIAKQQRLTGIVSRHRDVWPCRDADIADVEVGRWRGDVVLDVRALSRHVIRHSRCLAAATATELNCGSLPCCTADTYDFLVMPIRKQTSACNCKKVLFHI